MVPLLLGPSVIDAASGHSVPAFPGAEGFGAVAIGGRGGRVIKVTTLAADGPGSLAQACATPGPRIVVFDVAGVIRGDVVIRHSNITIAGQSAPAPGITLEGRLLARPHDAERLHDIVVRFLRVRPQRASGHGGDAVQLPKTERVMLDHLSLAWANDEVVDIIHSSEVTLQWSTLEESDTEGHGKGEAHNFAILSAYPESGNVSIHHNLFAHHARRAPSLSPQVPDKPGDFRNNVVYNFREALTHDGHRPLAPINLINNYYKRGPNSSTIYPFQFARRGTYFLGGNYIEGYAEIAVPAVAFQPRPWIRVAAPGALLQQAVSVARVTTHNAQEAYQHVLARAGAWPRDRITQRTIREVTRGTGAWGRHGPSQPSDIWFLDGLSVEPRMTDTDGDGMPDAWEDRRGLNKAMENDAHRIMDSGYTAVEEYLNERAESLIPRRSGEG